MQIKLLPAFEDNYLFILWDEKAHQAVAIDPGDAEPVMRWWLDSGKPQLEIWCTHHHGDHVGGVRSLKEQAGARVCAPSLDVSRFPGVDASFDSAWKWCGREVRLLALPGHTRDHVGFYIPSEKVVFVGDTLFSIGCGRVFDGTVEALFESLQKLAQLPGDTEVYCAHEYTLANLRFARAMDPSDEALRAFETETLKKRSHDVFSVPSNLGIEKRLNPFLRVTDAQWVQRVLGEALSPLEAFRLLRRVKDAPLDSKFAERFQ